jgi:hypothetical protein
MRDNIHAGEGKRNVYFVANPKRTETPKVLSGISYNLKSLDE